MEKDIETELRPIGTRAQAVVRPAVGEDGAVCEDAVLDPAVGEGELFVCRRKKVSDGYFNLS